LTSSSCSVNVARTVSAAVIAVAVFSRSARPDLRVLLGFACSSARGSGLLVGLGAMPRGFFDERRHPRLDGLDYLPA